VREVWGSNPEPIKSPIRCQRLATVATLIGFDFDFFASSEELLDKKDLKIYMLTILGVFSEYCSEFNIFLLKIQIFKRNSCSQTFLTLKVSQYHMIIHLPPPQKKAKTA